MLPSSLGGDSGESGDMATRPCQAGDVPGPDWVTTDRHDDGNRAGRALAARPHDRLRPLGVQLQRTDQGCHVLHGLDPLELPLQISHPPALQA